jgi:transposase
MDNASFHRKGEMKSLAEKAGVALLFLPAYSPDFNPIEHSWANMKRWLRDNESRFRALDSAIYHFFQCKGI